MLGGTVYRAYRSELFVGVVVCEARRRQLLAVAWARLATRRRPPGALLMPPVPTRRVPPAPACTNTYVLVFDVRPSSLLLLCHLILTRSPSVQLVFMYLRNFEFIERGKAVCIEDIFNAKLV